MPTSNIYIYLFIRGVTIHIFVLNRSISCHTQCVCSPCALRKRCRSSTDCAFTQESATNLWLFTTNTTFIHDFDFNFKHCH